MSRDPFYEKPSAICAGCKCEIWPGDDLLEFDGFVTHDDLDCIKRSLNPKQKTGAKYEEEHKIDEKERLVS